MAAIPEKFVAKILQPYVKTFPAAYCEHIYRLNNWDYNSNSSKRRGVIGHWTNDIIHARLAPAVLEEPKRRAPRDEKGRFTAKPFQMLTPEMGHPNWWITSRKFWRSCAGPAIGPSFTKCSKGHLPDLTRPCNCRSTIRKQWSGCRNSDGLGIKRPPTEAASAMPSGCRYLGQGLGQYGGYGRGSVMHVPTDDTRQGTS